MKHRSFRPKAAIAVIATIVLLGGACDANARHRQERELNIRHEMELAKRDFRAEQYDSAEDHFKRALALDDNLIEARMGLAVAYTLQYVPGDLMQENMISWKKAVDAFQDLVEKDSKNAVALKSLAALYVDVHEYSKARDFYSTATSANPDDADAYYGVGVTDWMAAYQDMAKRKSEAGLDTDAAFRNTPRDQKICMDLKGTNQTRVNDGLKNLTLAMENRQDFGDAKSFMSLLYQQKAEIECGNLTARTEDLKLSRKFALDAFTASNRAQQQASQLPGSGHGNVGRGDDLDFSKIAEQILPSPPPPPLPPPPPPPSPIRHENGQSDTAGDQG